MKNYYDKRDGYRKTIQKGLMGAKSFSGKMFTGNDTRGKQIEKLKNEIQHAEAIVIGAGAGLSTSAGLTYSGERFEKYFFDFAEKYEIRDMYSGGFYPFPDNETGWAWWARHIYLNRYIEPPKPVYKKLLSLIENKNYFVITTNVDHQFQRAGFDKKRLFYTQGDYGLFQSVNPKNQKTYDNEDWVYQAMLAQGFVRNNEGVFVFPDDVRVEMKLPLELVPKCPDDGSDMTINLRADDTFVEDEGWHKASKAYADFLKEHQNRKVLYMELGVGDNTPVIIKYPFWRMVQKNPSAKYLCVNYAGTYYPAELEASSLFINDDIDTLLNKLTS